MLQETKQGYQEMKGLLIDSSNMKVASASQGVLQGELPPFGTTMLDTTDTINQFWINVILENLMNNQKIVIYNIYAPNYYRDKA